MSYTVKQLPHVWGLIYFLKKKIIILFHFFFLFFLKRKEKKEREVSESKRLDEM